MNYVKLMVNDQRTVLVNLDNVTFACFDGQNTRIDTNSSNQQLLIPGNIIGELEKIIMKNKDGIGVCRIKGE